MTACDELTYVAVLLVGLVLFIRELLWVVNVLTS